MSQLSYFGKQPSNTSYVKSYPSIPSQSSQTPVFFYQMIDNVNYLTPVNPNIDVLFKQNLVVYGTITTPSDARLKQNITPIDPSISNKILTLLPKQYTYINKTDNHTHYGLLAQDVELVYPSLVKNDGKGNVKSVNYMELIPLLIAQIQSLQHQIDELKK
jgi:hypothetical protein